MYRYQRPGASVERLATGLGYFSIGLGRRSRKAPRSHGRPRAGRVHRRGRHGGARVYTRPLLDRIQKGDVDPSFIITHTMSLDDAPEG